MSATTRYFKLVNPETNKTYGRYSGDTPKHAVSKAFTFMLHKLKENGGDIPTKTTISLRESTVGSDRKTFTYECSRVELPEPCQLEFVDKETGERKTITYYYRNRVKRIGASDEEENDEPTQQSTENLSVPTIEKNITKQPINIEL